MFFFLAKKYKNTHTHTSRTLNTLFIHINYNDASMLQVNPDHYGK